MPTKVAGKKTARTGGVVAGEAPLRQSILLVRHSKGKPDLALVLTGEFKKEGRNWLAQCLETGTATFGLSLDDARGDLFEDVLLQLDGVERLGFLADYLEERNIKPMAITPPGGDPLQARQRLNSFHFGHQGLDRGLTMGTAMSGKELIDLLKRDGWQASGRSRHGIFLFKQVPGEEHQRTTTVPDKRDDLPTGALGAILSVSQTGLGKDGLKQLIKKYR